MNCGPSIPPSRPLSPRPEYGPRTGTRRGGRLHVVDTMRLCPPTNEPGP